MNKIITFGGGECEMATKKEFLNAILSVARQGSF